MTASSIFEFHPQPMPGDEREAADLLRRTAQQERAVAQYRRQNAETQRLLALDGSLREAAQKRKDARHEFWMFILYSLWLFAGGVGAGLGLSTFF